MMSRATRSIRAICAAALLCAAVAVVAHPLLPAQRRVLALSHVNVVDVQSGRILPDVTITIAEGHISGIDASMTRVRSEAQVVDGHGKYVIPGLWDMHVHWYDERLLSLFLANGVTGVRQMFGGPNLLRWRREIEAGTLLGPRHVVASPIVDGPQPIWPGSIVVADAARGREVVRGIKRDGYDFVKVYNRLPRDAYFAILAEAAQQHITVVGHVPNAVTIGEAVDAGQKTIEHLTGILLGASREEGDVRRASTQLRRPTANGPPLTPAEASALRAHQERLLTSYDETKAAALFARFRAKDTWQCPTLTVLRAGASLNLPPFTSDPRLKYMPLATRRGWSPEASPLRRWKTDADYEVERRTLHLQFRIVGAMQRAGVRVLAGTDVSNPFVFPGFSLHDELGLLVDAGLTPLEALQAATVNPAQFLGRLDQHGTVERGRLADLVLLDANPLADISATKRIAAVVFAGRLYDRTALDAMLADAERVVKP
jgi:imidazolonepropionase-like amidohydrolase